MSDQSPLRSLASELDRLGTPGEGSAYVSLFAEEDGTGEIVADRDGLLSIAAACVRTAAMAEEEHGLRISGPSLMGVFKPGSDVYIWHATHDPSPSPRQEPVAEQSATLALMAIAGGCLGVLALAIVGLVAIIRWVM